MPTHHRETFGQDVVNDLRKMLREAPDPPDEKPAEYSKLRLIRDLAPELRALARRGWSWKALAAMVSRRVAISPDLLQSYVRGRSRVSRKGRGETNSAPTKLDPAAAPKSGLANRTSPTPQALSNPPAHAKSAGVEELVAEDAWVTDDEPATGRVGLR